ncbi:general substrate transporter [Epithele typhae]|uniref:general substrate transporter n=1 Tax=Epithele typhae TaxID=378194 RepID=UPI002008C995|nr:general substrate transporter [Epithele typhae]KAH9942457.1 general substrate transporter [Epithele typhae]
MSTFVDRLRPKTFPRHYPRWMVGRPLLIGSSAFASLGDAMFGYSQGVIAALQVQPPFIRRFFGHDVTLAQIQAGDTGINPWVQSITVSSLNITAFIASFFAAYLCDILGGIIYFIAAAIQIGAPNLAALICGRALQGVAVGILSMTVPILQCEIAPGMPYICLNLGYTLSAWIGFAFFFSLPSETSWRGPYAIQAAFAVLLVMWSFVLPETPRFLIKNGFLDEGRRVLADLHADGNEDDLAVRATFVDIQAAVALEAEQGEASWGQLFRQYRRRTLVGITCQVFAQCNGINAILYFLPSNLTRAGFPIERSLLYAAAAAIVYSSGTLVTMVGIDRIGRRPFLLVGSVLLAGFLAIIGSLQHHVDAIPIGPARIPGANGIFAAVSLYLWTYGATWGPTPWLLGAEIFPMRARAKGMALSNAANWLCNFAVAFATPPLFAALRAGYYFILAGACLLSGAVVFFVYPETAHRTLEDLGEVFADADTDTGDDRCFAIERDNSRFAATGSSDGLEAEFMRERRPGVMRKRVPEESFADSASTLQVPVGVPKGPRPQRTAKEASLSV